MKEFVLWENLYLYISEEDYGFLCDHRFYTSAPSIEDLISEFVTGTGITPNKRDLWSCASEKFAEYIQDLREIESMNINRMAQNILSEDEKHGFAT